MGCITARSSVGANWTVRVAYWDGMEVGKGVGDAEGNVARLLRLEMSISRSLSSELAMGVERARSRLSQLAVGMARATSIGGTEVGEDVGDAEEVVVDLLEVEVLLDLIGPFLS